LKKLNFLIIKINISFLLDSMSTTTTPGPNVADFTDAEMAEMMDNGGDGATNSLNALDAVNVVNATDLEEFEAEMAAFNDEHDPMGAGLITYKVAPDDVEDPGGFQAPGGVQQDPVTGVQDPGGFQAPVPVDQDPGGVQQAPEPVDQAPGDVQQAPEPVDQAPGGVQQDHDGVQQAPEPDAQVQVQVQVHGDQQGPVVQDPVIVPDGANSGFDFGPTVPVVQQGPPDDGAFGTVPGVRAPDGVHASVDDGSFGTVTGGTVVYSDGTATGPQPRVAPGPQPRVAPGRQPRVAPGPQPRVATGRQPRVAPGPQPRVARVTPGSCYQGQVFQAPFQGQVFQRPMYQAPIPGVRVLYNPYQGQRLQEAIQCDNAMTELEKYM
jgi:hypothetical protein